MAELDLRGRTFGEIFRPADGQALRFCTAGSLSNDLLQHGMNGFYRDGRFWSADMADHWAPHEVTLWSSNDMHFPAPTGRMAP